MKTKLTLAAICALALAACSNSSSNSGGSPPDGGPEKQKPIAAWQAQFLGQEGHGGDAIVCFSIPVSHALYQARFGAQDPECTPNGPCRAEGGSASSGSSSPTSGVVWRMTDAGRKSIRSAQPLEQYLGARMAGSKPMFDELAKLSVADGYKKMLKVYTQLPGAFSRVQSIHDQLGWLTEDGIASEYGLMDINDSGLSGETEIDNVYCKELQAVVRRDNQLWYDADIVAHFDQVGRVLMQLHEELYAWAKEQDELNQLRPPMHTTSAKTRRLILKMLDVDTNSEIMDTNLKALGFSVHYWENSYHSPTSPGHFMDTQSCRSEQKDLHDFFQRIAGSKDFWPLTQQFVYQRYLSGEEGIYRELAFNFPVALKNIIDLAVAGTPSFPNDVAKLQIIFERPESCEPSFR